LRCNGRVFHRQTCGAALRSIARRTRYALVAPANSGTRRLRYVPHDGGQLTMQTGSRGHTTVARGDKLCSCFVYKVESTKIFSCFFSLVRCVPSGVPKYLHRLLEVLCSMATCAETGEQSTSELSCIPVDWLPLLGPEPHEHSSFSYASDSLTEGWKTWLHRFTAEALSGTIESLSQDTMSESDHGTHSVCSSILVDDLKGVGYPNWKRAPLNTSLDGGDLVGAANAAAHSAALSPVTPQPVHLDTQTRLDAMSPFCEGSDPSASSTTTTKTPWCRARSTPLSETSSIARAGPACFDDLSTDTQQPNVCIFCAHLLEASHASAVQQVLHSIGWEALRASRGGSDHGRRTSSADVSASSSMPTRNLSLKRDVAGAGGEPDSFGEDHPRTAKKLKTKPSPGTEQTIDTSLQEYLADSIPLNNGIEKDNRKRRDWTSEEDNRLRQLVEAYLSTLRTGAHMTRDREPRGPWPHEDDDHDQPDSEYDPTRNAYGNVQVSVSGLRIPWTQIASRLPGRTAARCRERYRNYLDPSIRHEPFSAREDLIILREYERRGPAWAFIASKLKGRSENAVKNRLHSLIRRARRSSAVI